MRSMEAEEEWSLGVRSDLLLLFGFGSKRCQPLGFSTGFGLVFLLPTWGFLGTRYF